MSSVCFSVHFDVTGGAGVQRKRDSATSVSSALLSCTYERGTFVIACGARFAERPAFVTYISTYRRPRSGYICEWPGGAAKSISGRITGIRKTPKRSTAQGS